MLTLLMLLSWSHLGQQCSELRFANDMYHLKLQGQALLSRAVVCSLDLDGLF